MTRDTFFNVYMGTVHPRTAILNGDVKVHGWAFQEMANFGASFDFATEKWDSFYEWRKTQPPLTVPLTRLRPLPFNLPRPHSCTPPPPNQLFNIPFISFLFSPATAVCEPREAPLVSNISHSQVSVPAVAFSEEHGQNAFCAIQSHRKMTMPLCESVREVAISVMGDTAMAMRPALASFSSQVDQAGGQAAAKKAQIMQASQIWLSSVRRRIQSFTQPSMAQKDV